MTKIDVELSCNVFVALDLLRHSSPPFGIGKIQSGADLGDLHKAHRAACAALGDYADALWKAGVTCFGDRVADTATHAVSTVIRSIVNATDPRVPEWREAATYAAAQVREAAK